MSRIIIFFCSLLLIMTMGCASTPQGTRIAERPTEGNFLVRILSGSPAMPGRPAPDVVLTNLNGRAINLKQAMGKDMPTILLFSSTSCPYSTKEHLEVAEAMETLRKRAKAVTILVNETPHSAREYLNTNRAPGTILVDSKGKAADAYRIEMVPTLLMIDSRGYVYEFRHFTPKREVLALMAGLRRQEATIGSGCAPSG